MALQEVNLGRIIFMWKGDWEANKTYYLYDIVKVDKVGLFFCTTPHISDDENKPKVGSSNWDLAFDFTADIHADNADKLGDIPADQYVTLEYLTNNVLNKITNLQTDITNNIGSQIESVKQQIQNKADKSTTATKTELNTAKTELTNSFNEKLALKRDKSDSYNKTEVDNKITTAKTELNSALANKANSSEVYKKSETYTQTQVNNLLNNKADKSTTYTKTEVDTKLNTKANTSTTYTKTEVDTKLNNAVLSNNGLQTRFGTFSVGGSLNTNDPQNTGPTITFSSAFPNKCIAVFILYTFFDNSKDGSGESPRQTLRMGSNLTKSNFKTGLSGDRYSIFEGQYIALGY